MSRSPSIWANAILVALALACPAFAQAPDSDRAAKLMDDLMWGRGNVGGPFAFRCRASPSSTVSVRLFPMLRG
jgi:hypothetical protein